MALGPLREVDDRRAGGKLDPEDVRKRLGPGPEAQNDVGHPFVFFALEHLHEPLTHGRFLVSRPPRELSYICRQRTTHLSTPKESCNDRRSCSCPGVGAARAPREKTGREGEKERSS